MARRSSKVRVLREVVKPLAPNALEIARLVGLDRDGTPIVDLARNDSPGSLRARSLVAASEAHVGREVALMFESGDVAKPVIIGFLVPPGTPAETSLSAARLSLNADTELLLRCGGSTIPLARGKIENRADHLDSRAKGANRIKGGSVQIN